MKKRTFIFLLFSLALAALLIYQNKARIFTKNNFQHLKQVTQTPPHFDKLKNGDIIFQTSLSGQSKAVQLATHSKYSHCGIIFYKLEGEYFVYEAAETVKMTPLAEWIARGESQHYVIKRLKNADSVLTPSAIAQMKQVGNQYNGFQYDLAFNWSDEKMYCSELVWKIYKNATGIEVGKLQKLKSFDLQDETVKQLLNDRYGNHIPLEETTISPADVFESDLLREVQAE